MKRNTHFARKSSVVDKRLRVQATTQLAHDVVPRLGFGCFLVTMSDDVVTTLYFRRRYYDQNLTLLQLCDFDVGFLTWY